MRMNRLFVPITLIGGCILGITSTSAAVISFSEPLTGTAPIAVSSDIGGATMTATAETAQLRVGDTSGPSTLLLKRAMTNQGTMTGGGGGMGLATSLNSIALCRMG
jgi:hypothetical protein